MSAYVVMLESDCWLAAWGGDPGRTTVLENARRFKTEKEAIDALKRSRKYRPFKNAKIKQVAE